MRLLDALKARFRRPRHREVVAEQSRKLQASIDNGSYGHVMLIEHPDYGDMGRP